MLATNPRSSVGAIEKSAERLSALVIFVAVEMPEQHSELEKIKFSFDMTFAVFKVVVAVLWG